MHCFEMPEVKWTLVYVSKGIFQHLLVFRNMPQKFSLKRFFPRCHYSWLVWKEKEWLSSLSFPCFPLPVSWYCYAVSDDCLPGVFCFVQLLCYFAYLFCRCASQVFWCLLKFRNIKNLSNFLNHTSSSNVKNFRQSKENETSQHNKNNV